MTWTEICRFWPYSYLDIAHNSVVYHTIRSGWRLLSEETLVRYSVTTRGSPLLYSLLASFPCTLNTFRKRVKNVVTAREFKWGLSVNMWSGVKCSDVEWTDVIYVKWFYFEIKWSKLRWRKKKKKWHVYEGDLILRVLDCIVTFILVYFVLRLF
jgi:hypothetical protein